MCSRVWHEWRVIDAINYADNMILDIMARQTRRPYPSSIIQWDRTIPVQFTISSSAFCFVFILLFRQREKRLALKYSTALGLGTLIVNANAPNAMPMWHSSRYTIFNSILNHVDDRHNFNPFNTHVPCTYEPSLLAAEEGQSWKTTTTARAKKKQQLFLIRNAALPEAIPTTLSLDESTLQQSCFSRDRVILIVWLPHVHMCVPLQTTTTTAAATTCSFALCVLCAVCEYTE